MSSSIGGTSASGGLGFVAGAVSGGRGGAIGGAVGGVLGADSGSNAAGGAMGGFIGGLFGGSNQVHANAWNGSQTQKMLKGGWAGLVGGAVQDLVYYGLMEMQDCGCET